MYHQDSFYCIFDRDMAMRLTHVETYGEHLIAVCFYIRNLHCHTNRNHTIFAFSFNNLKVFSIFRFSALRWNRRILELFIPKLARKCHAGCIDEKNMHHTSTRSVPLTQFVVGYSKLIWLKIPMISILRTEIHRNVDYRIRILSLQIVI